MKNRRKKWGAALAMALAGLGLLAACSSNMSDIYATGETGYAPATNYEGGAYDGEAYYDYDGQTAAYGEATGGGGHLTAPADDRKVIMTARLEMQTLEYNETVAALQQAVSRHGGYVAGSSLRGSAEGSRSAEFEFKIPAGNYNAFMQETEEAGSVTYRNEYSEDVTSQYVDLEARLTSLRTQEARLLEMLEESADLDTLLRIQNQLTEVQYSIESYTGSLRRLEASVSYSTVTVQVYEVAVITQPPPETYGSRVAEAFSASWQRALRTVQNIGLWFVGNTPSLLVLAVALVAGLLLWRRRRRKHRGPVSPAPVTAAIKFQPGEEGDGKKE